MGECERCMLRGRIYPKVVPIEMFNDELGGMRRAVADLGRWDLQLGGEWHDNPGIYHEVCIFLDLYDVRKKEADAWTVPITIHQEEPCCSDEMHRLFVERLQVALEMLEEAVNGNAEGPKGELSDEFSVYHGGEKDSGCPVCSGEKYIMFEGKSLPCGQCNFATQKERDWELPKGPEYHVMVGGECYLNCEHAGVRDHTFVTESDVQGRKMRLAERYRCCRCGKYLHMYTRTYFAVDGEACADCVEKKGIGSGSDDILDARKED